MFLLVFSITWIFGYAFINRSPHNTLYGYLYAIFNFVTGLYILLFVCVQHDKVSVLCVFILLEQQSPYFSVNCTGFSLIRVNALHLGPYPDDSTYFGNTVVVRLILKHFCLLLLHAVPERVPEVGPTKVPDP